MRTSLKAILAGTAIAGAVALANGAASPAVAQDDSAHTLLVQLPNGSVEQIEYTGPVAPQVVLTRSPFAADPAFAVFEQIAARMDQQAAAMLQQVADMPGLNDAMPALPPGASGYASVTTISDGHACTRSTEVRYDGRDTQPQAVSNVSGDCGAAPEQRTTPAMLPAPSPRPQAASQTIRVKYTRPAPSRALVHEAFYQHPQGRAD